MGGVFSILVRYTLRKAAIAVAIVGVSMLFKATALADETKVWVSPGAVSYHFDRSKGYNEFNYGLGVDYAVTDSIGAGVGVYKNSQGKKSFYLLAGYKPLTLWGVVRVGVLAGIVNGYGDDRKDITPVVLPVASIEGEHIGADLSVVPPIGDKVDGAVAVRLKFRF